MEIEEFWNLIDITREASDGDVYQQAHLLVEILRKRSVDELFSYEKFMDNLLDEAYDAELLDAAYIIGCRCSDDGFRDFRAWLIAQGQEVYDNVLVNPESLLDLIDVNDDTQNGALFYVTMHAYEQKTGQDIPPKNYSTKSLLSVNRNALTR